MSRQTFQRLCIHGAAALAAVAGAYALAGFIVLPAWVERELPTWADSAGASVRVGDLRFNPFLLEARVDQLDIATPGGVPVAHIPSARVDLGWSSLLRRAWVLEAIRIHQPEVTLSVDKAGQLNLAVLANRKRTGAVPQGEKDGGLPALVIESLLIEEGKLRYVDDRAHGLTPLRVAPVRLTAHDLSTLEGVTGEFHVRAGVGDDAVLATAGEIGLQPVSATGRVAVRSLDIAPIAAIAIRSDDVAAPQGRLDVALRYRVASRDSSTSFSATDVNAMLRKFSWRLPGTDRPFAAWSRAAITGASVDTVAHTAKLGSVALVDGRIGAIVDEHGRLNLARLAAALGSDEPRKVSSGPWRVDIANAHVRDVSAQYVDRAPHMPMEAVIARIAAAFSASMTLGGDKPDATLRGLVVGLHDMRLRTTGTEPVSIKVDSANLEGGTAHAQPRRFSAAAISLDRARISLRPDAAKAPDIALGRVQVEAARIDAADRIVRASALRFGDLTGTLVRGEEGIVGMPSTADTRSAVAAEAGASDSTEGADPPSWQVRIAQVSGDAKHLEYRDRTLSPPMRAMVEGARIELGLDVQTGRQTRVVVDALDAEANHVSLVPADADGSPVKLGKLTVSGGHVDTSKQSASAKSVIAAGAEVGVLRTDNGAMRIAGIRVPRGETRNDATSTAPDWQYQIGSIGVNDASVSLVDRSFDEPIAYRIALNGRARNVDPASPDPIQVDLDVRVETGGTLRAQGRVHQDFSAATARLDLDGLAMNALDPILAQYAYLNIASGRASGAIDINYTQNEDQPLLRLEGQAALDDVIVNEPGREEPFVAWKRVDAQGIHASISPHRLDIGNVEVRGPQAELVVSEKRTLNLSRVLRKDDAETSSSATDDTTPATDTEAPFPIHIGRVRMSDGRLQFADLSLVLPFSTRIHDLEGVIVGLSSEPGAQAELRLDGRIADYGAASASGSLDAFQPTRFMDITVDFDNVLIPPFSPYAATFAGRTIESGRVWLDLDYRIAKGELSGENKIVVQNLELGRKVEAPQAQDWPLDLALALLQDADNRISMQIPVSGDVGDPEFDYGQIIRKAIGGALQRIVTAPFRALASLFGGKKDLDAARTVLFNPGSPRLAHAESEQLADLAKVLAARPNLRLIVHGPFDRASDTRELRKIAVRRQVNAALGRASAPSGIPDPIVFSDPSTQEALDLLLEQRLTPEDHAAFKRIIGPNDPQYYAAAFGEIAARVEITDARLEELANNRAQAIADAVNRQGIALARVAVGKPRSAHEDESGVPRIAAELNLNVYRPDAARLAENP